MTTTGLVVELVVIGVGGLLWALAIAVSILGFRPIATMLGSATLLVPGLSIAYVVGIVLDRIADWIFSPWDNKIRVSILGSVDEYRRVRMLLYGRGSRGTRTLFEYTKSRIRVARAWCVSLALCTLTSLWTLIGAAARGERLRCVCQAGFLALALAVASGLLAWSWRRLVVSDYRRLQEARNLLLDKPLSSLPQDEDEGRPDE